MEKRSRIFTIFHIYRYFRTAAEVVKRRFLRTSFPFINFWQKRIILLIPTYTTPWCWYWFTIMHENVILKDVSSRTNDVSSNTNKNRSVIHLDMTFFLYEPQVSPAQLYAHTIVCRPTRSGTPMIKRMGTLLSTDQRKQVGQWHLAPNFWPGLKQLCRHLIWWIVLINFFFKFNYLFTCDITGIQEPYLESALWTLTRP